MKIAVLCDFDGTITLQDMGIEILKEFSTADWERIEEKFDQGKVSILENMSEQFSHVPNPPHEVNEFVKRNAKIRPGWEEFIECCRGYNLHLAIVSGGLRSYIYSVLGKNLNIPVYSLVDDYVDGQWLLSLPSPFDRDGDVEFKEAVINYHRKQYDEIWFIGNGTSDRRAAEVADRVWALEPLLSYALSKGLKVHSFESFYDICTDFQKILGGQILKEDEIDKVSL
ncbi:HAD-superfamily hydrolase, subfamily IB (PSPase-like) [Thermobaculum terrenum ATCC BAA-798]|uniref:HAD-superfamily hydrolase, subfamily IB (PSPase-like) n=1 Tax=Thermobaculum terrenum (strain ATCC BAA-798 / CCMEE 7001 / YNP1) TaxID=525904 RepID=D1CFS5_THET1|nr:HAD-IB family phosphatase [Thermobaculum terrenum]ACZ41781.1 HAD-superfamily hydrolase, subfamily IB (PSPase-like) [Thermobaculum terrenum ATCC BAA-798]